MILSVVIGLDHDLLAYYLVMAGLGETRVVSLSIIIMSLNNICDASFAGQHAC